MAGWGHPIGRGDERAALVAQIRRPAVQLPDAPKQYSQQEEQEFRRIVARILSESIEDAVRPDATASFSIGAQTADDGTDRYTYSWTATGHPRGTTYNLLYRYTNTAGTLVEEGTVTGATSGNYIQSSGNIGASPTYVITVDAVNAGQVIDTRSRTGTFVT